MLSLALCGFVLALLIFIFLVYGEFFIIKLNIKSDSFPMRVLVGFFSYFIVMQLLILPIVFLKGSVDLACILWIVLNVLSVAYFLRYEIKNGYKLFSDYRLGIFLTVLMLVVVMTAVLTRYAGWDIAYYIGEMNEFLYHNSFWTHDALEGGTLALINGVPRINLHYAQSSYYPFWAILCRIFNIEARLMVLYTARALCVILSTMVAYCIGEEVFVDRKRANALVCVFLVLALYATASHSSAAMMIQRGYESKGYCAAVVAPAIFLALYKVAKDYTDREAWIFTGLIAWASMPIAMSSMAIIPGAIIVVSISLMIYHRKFVPIFKPALICVLPNAAYMLWYAIWIFMSH